MTWVMYETKTLISIYHRYHLESFPKCIERYWFMGSRANKKVYDFQKLSWVPMNFYHAKRLFSMGIEILGLGNAGSGSPFQTLQLY